jgi:hypothetical protein
MLVMLLSRLISANFHFRFRNGQEKFSLSHELWVGTNDFNTKKHFLYSPYNLNLINRERKISKQTTRQLISKQGNMFIEI